MQLFFILCIYKDIPGTPTYVLILKALQWSPIFILSSLRILIGDFQIYLRTNFQIDFTIKMKNLQIWSYVGYPPNKSSLSTYTVLIFEQALHQAEDVETFCS
jgi:hypothetical protein